MAPRALLFASIAVCLSIAFGIAGQLLMKRAALLTVGAGWDLSSVAILALALLVYSSGIINWIFALRHLRLSVAYPLTSLSYVGILWGSYYWFGERISTGRVVGVALIFIGVLLVVLRWPRLRHSDRQSDAMRNTERP